MNFDSFLRVWLHDMHLFRKTNSILPFDTFSVGTRPESAAFLRFTITWSSVFTSSPPWKDLRPNLNNMQTTIQTSLQNGKMIVSEKRVVTWKQDGKRGRGDGRKNQRFVFACFFSQLKMALRILIRFLVTLWWHLFKGAVSLKPSDAFRFKISISFKLCPLIFLS